MALHRSNEPLPPDDMWIQGLGTPLWAQFGQITDDKEEIEAMVQTYRTYNLTHHDALVRPYEGVVDEIRRLKDAGKRLGVVTSKLRDGAMRGLRVSGLDDAFDIVIGCDDVTHSKPHPEPVLKAVEELRRRETGCGPMGAIRPRRSRRSVARLLAGETGRAATALPAMTPPLPLPTRFVPFDLERWQSTLANRVRFNLSESGVHPLTIQELLGLAGASALPLLDVRLGYSQSNGTELLRERIAALYPGASPDQVLVTTGSSEANFVTCWRLLEPGDKVAVMMPNYLQTWGLAQNFGAHVKGFQLQEKEG